MTSPDSPSFSTLYAQGRFHELIALARQQSLTAETDPEHAQMLAIALFKVGEFASADSVLQGLEAAFGLNADFLSLYGANCRRLGRLSDAENLFQRALRLDPDSQGIRNNYANLLIDLARFDEAQLILSKLLVENSEYEDARSNFNRLSLLKADTSPTSTCVESGEVDGWSLADPLLLAFSDEEVERTTGRKPKPSTPASQALVAALPDTDQRAVALDQLQLAEKAVAEKQFTFALDLCSQALRVLGSHAPVYDCASDAYLNLKHFKEAELCLLQALALGGPTPKRCLNLVSFASMRGDFALARHHLQQAAAVDPSHPQLAGIRQALDKRTNKTVNTAPYRFPESWLEADLKHAS